MPLRLSVSTRRVDAKTIIAAGWSLGGAVAIDLASRRQVGGLIVFSTFTSGVEMARRMLPFVPVSLLLRHRFDSVHKIAKIRCPILIGHGRRDPLIPFRWGKNSPQRPAVRSARCGSIRPSTTTSSRLARQIDRAIAGFLEQLAAPDR